MNKLIIYLLVVSFVLIHAQSYGGCEATPAFAHRDSLAVREYLHSLVLYSEGCRIDGLFLCDGTNPLAGMIFLGKVKTRPRWMVYLLYNPQEKRRVAYAWVEAGGEKMPIPHCDENCVFGPDALNIYNQAHEDSFLLAGPQTLLINYPNQD
ncbi:MAG: hypothetical protein KKA70_08455 [Proteobacteria bacterium]|nr:hypothetical protein [Pseudomonadota bacterium]